MEDGFYHSRDWLELAERVRVRDGHRCTVARLLGGRCSGTLHVHHLIPRSERPDLELDEDNCGTSCASHHPLWESVARTLRLLHGELPRCPHRHPYESGRRACAEQRRRKMLDRVGRLSRVAA
jgi:hypothetical protein